MGFTLKWDYVHCNVWLSIPDYVNKALHRLQHDLPWQPQHAPHRYNKPSYGQKVQFATPQDSIPSPFLPLKAKKKLKTIGIFLYFWITMDLTMLVALCTLTFQQENPTEALWDDITSFSIMPPLTLMPRFVTPKVT